MDNSQKALIAKLEAMPFEEALKAIAEGKIYIGDPGSINHDLVSGWIAKKEAFLRHSREEESLSISKSANSIARDALNNSRRSNIIAIIAVILSAATAIGVAIFQWLYK